jgi:hypothetical protein
LGPFITVFSARVDEVDEISPHRGSLPSCEAKNLQGECAMSAASARDEHLGCVLFKKSGMSRNELRDSKFFQ